MNRSLILVLLLSLSNCNTKEWKTYQYHEYGISIDLPKEPEIKTPKYSDSEYEYFLVTCELAPPGKDFTAYSFFYINMFENFDSSDSSSVKEYFAFIEKQVDSKKADRVLEIRKYKFNQYPAIEYKLEYSEGRQVTITRYILANDKSIQLGVVCPSESMDDSEHLKFLDSFKFLK